MLPHKICDLLRHSRSTHPPNYFLKETANRTVFSQCIWASIHGEANMLNFEPHINIRRNIGFLMFLDRLV